MRGAPAHYQDRAPTGRRPAVPGRRAEGRPRFPDAGGVREARARPGPEGQARTPAPDPSWTPPPHPDRSAGETVWRSQTILPDRAQDGSGRRRASGACHLTAPGAERTARLDARTDFPSLGMEVGRSSLAGPRRLGLPAPCGIIVQGYPSTPVKKCAFLPQRVTQAPRPPLRTPPGGGHRPRHLAGHPPDPHPRPPLPRTPPQVTPQTPTPDPPPQDPPGGPLLGPPWTPPQTPLPGGSPRGAPRAPPRKISGKFPGRARGAPGGPRGAPGGPGRDPSRTPRLGPQGAIFSIFSSSWGAPRPPSLGYPPRPPSRGAPGGAPRGGPACTFFWVFNNSPSRDKMGHFPGPPPGRNPGPPDPPSPGYPPWTPPQTPRVAPPDGASPGRTGVSPAGTPRHKAVTAQH